MTIDFKDEKFLKSRINSLEEENARLRSFIKDCYKAGCAGDENEIGCMLADMLEELGYEFDDEGRLEDDEDDA